MTHEQQMAAIEALQKIRHDIVMLVCKMDFSEEKRQGLEIVKGMISREIAEIIKK